MSQSENSGLMSSAGLVRYFDEDSSRTKLDPRTFLVFCAAVGIALQVITAAPI